MVAVRRLAWLLLLPVACDDLYSCRLEPEPDEPWVHEREVGYETDQRRYTVTIVSDDPWPPAADAAGFELWARMTAGAAQPQLVAEPAFREGAEAERVMIPVQSTEHGAWTVGPVALEPGVWHLPLQLEDEQGGDAIELIIELVDR